MIKDKLLRLAEKVEEIKRRQPSENPQYHRLSGIRLILMPVGILMYNFKSFCLLCCIFAPLMAVLSFATHNSVICGLGSDLSEMSPFGCAAPNQAVYITFLLLRLLILVVFLKSWYRIAVKGDIVYVRDVLLITAQDWKLFVVTLIALLINVLPLISTMFLAARVPNPNWLIETAYFAVVSCGFWLPFVAIRFYSIPAFVAADEKLPRLGQIFRLTVDNGLKLLVSFVITILFCALLMLYFLTFCEFVIPHGPFVFGIVTEVLYDVALLAVVSLLLNYCITQKQELFAVDNGSDDK